MTQEEYIRKQITNIDSAIASAKELLRASANLHRVCDIADEKKDFRKDEASKFFRDSLMYFSFNSAATELSGEKERLSDFKAKLIEIKIANDRMLFEGGYRKDIDDAIASTFLSHTLCKIQIIDEKVLNTVREAVEMLEKMKADLQG